MLHIHHDKLYSTTKEAQENNQINGEYNWEGTTPNLNHTSNSNEPL